MTDRVDIEVVDKISTGPAKKLLDLAKAAEQAYRNLEKVNGAIRATAQAEAMQARAATTSARAVEQAGDAMVRSFRHVAAERQAANAKQVKAQQELTRQVSAELGRIDDASAKSVARTAATQARANAARLQREGSVGDGMVALWANNQLRIAKQQAAGEAREKVSLARRADQVKKFGMTYEDYFKKLTLTYTANDVVASLASGASPLTILLQQGGQVTQAFGGLTNTLKTFGRFLLTPIGLVGTFATAMIGLGLAVDSAEKKIANFGRTLDYTNGYTGLTVSGLQSLIDKTAEQGKVTRSTAEESITALAKSGSFQKDTIEKLALATVNLSKITGQSGEEIAKTFATMAESPSKYAEAFNSQFHILSLAQVNHIQELEETGRKSEATRVLTQALYDEYGKNAVAALSKVSSRWSALARTIDDATDATSRALRRITGTATLQEQLKVAQTTLETARKLQNNKEISPSTGKPRGSDAEAAAAQRVVNDLQEKISREQKAAERQSTALRLQQEGIIASKEIDRISASVADNWTKGNNAVLAFRSNLEKMKLADPTDKKYLANVANQPKIEQGLRDQFNPKAAAAAKRDATAAETYAQAVEKVKTQLEGELKLEGLLGEERAKQQKINEITSRFSALGGLKPGDEKFITSQIEKIAALGEETRNLQSTYENIVGPLREFELTENSLNRLLAENKINSDQYDQQLRMLTESQKNYNDPLRQTKQALEDETAGLEANAASRANVIALKQIERQLDAQGKKLSPIDREAISLTLSYNSALAKLNAYQEEYASVGIPALQELSIRQEALNRARAAGSITASQYSIALNQLKLAEVNQKLAMGEGGIGTAMTAGLNSLVENYTGVLTGLKTTFGSFFQTISAGFADSIGNAIVMGDSLGDALGNAARQGLGALISGLIQVGVQYLVNAAIGTAATATTTAASTAAAATTAAAWAPAAALVSAATFGANAAPAGIGLASVIAIAIGALALGAIAGKGFKSGGYTGSGGVNSAAGVVHGKEFVVNAAGTRRNRGMLEAMNRGGTVASGGSGSRVTVRQYPGVDIETQITHDDIEIVARRVTRQEAPKVVAQQLGRRNSTVSKSFSDAYKATRRT